MTDRELLQQALDALKKHDDKWLECGERVWFEEEIKEIGERLAQPEPKLVADKYLMEVECTKCGAKQDGILTVNAPPKKEWVSLTDEEIKEVFYAAEDGYLFLSKAIEAKLKEKNNG